MGQAAAQLSATHGAHSLQLLPRCQHPCPRPPGGPLFWEHLPRALSPSALLRPSSFLGVRSEAEPSGAALRGPWAWGQSVPWGSRTPAPTALNRLVLLGPIPPG